MRKQPLRVTGIEQVAFWEQIASGSWRIWKLIPVHDENPPTEFDGEKHATLPVYSAK